MATQSRAVVRGRRVLRVSAITILLVGPIAAMLAEGDDQSPKAFVRVAGSMKGTPIDTAERGITEPGAAAMQAQVVAYLAGRSPLVDQLLPEGYGGTVFFESLDGTAGMAFQRSGRIGLSMKQLGDGTATTEMHERAHLLHGFQPREANALLKLLGEPAAGTYAATNASEHFAEMAASAWKLIVPEGDFCWALGPRERVLAAESEVPGTAGFIVYYLTSGAMPPMADQAELLATADSIAAPHAAAWERLFATVTSRALADGTMRPWAKPNLAGRIARWHAELRSSEHLLQQVGSFTLLPSLLVARIAGVVTGWIPARG